MRVKHITMTVSGENWSAEVEAVAVVDEKTDQIQFGAAQVKSTNPEQLNEVQSHALYLKGQELVEQIAKE